MATSLETKRKKATVYAAFEDGMRVALATFPVTLGTCHHGARTGLGLS